MTVSELKNKIKSSDICGAYLFGGEEDYLKKYYLGELEAAVCPDEVFAPFNKIVFDGEDVTVADIKEAIASPPMMSELKIVEWRYPDIEHFTEKEMQGLIELAEYTKTFPYAIFAVLVSLEGLDLGSAKKPSRDATRLGKQFFLVNFEKSTDAQLLGWLRKHFDAAGVGFDAAALQALIFRSGHGMHTLRNEVDKLLAYAKANGRDKVDVAMVNEVASATLECDAFALSGAVTDKNKERAFLAIKDMQMRRMEPAAVMAMLCRAFGELVLVSMLMDEGRDQNDMEGLLRWNPYKIKICIASAKKWGTQRLTRALGRLREIDAYSKSGGSRGFAPIEAFVSEFV